MSKSLSSEQIKRMEEGLVAVEQGDTLTALTLLEKLASPNSPAKVFSYLGYCLARERGLVEDALALCKEALQREPANPIHYRNLSRIYECAGARRKAIAALEKGMRFGRASVLRAEMRRLGVRRDPIIPFLSRMHPVNKYVGLWLAPFRRRPLV